MGQTPYVTERAGLVQSRDGQIVHIHAGDFVYGPPDEWHWHGATPNDFMTHLSLTEGVGESQKPESQRGPLVTDSEYHADNQQAESTFATVRHRTKITRGPGSRAAGLAMAVKLIMAAA